MTGGDEDIEDRGIIPWTISYIFNKIEQDKSGKYEIHISYLEIYNNVGYDLLYETNEEEDRNLQSLPKI